MYMYIYTYTYIYKDIYEDRNKTFNMLKASEKITEDNVKTT